MKPEPRVLVVDDDPDIATMLVRALSRRGFVMETAASADEALERIAKSRFDAALVDLVMPGRDGKDLAAALRERVPGLPIGLLTGYTRSPLLAAAEPEVAFRAILRHHGITHILVTPEGALRMDARGHFREQDRRGYL